MNQYIYLLMSLVALAASQNCTNTLPFTCPPGNLSFCSSDSLKSNIILRCSDGCPSPGNCNINLSGSPPVGQKTDGLCWQSSPDAGDAQCTRDCVEVTAANGITFYPVGCSFNPITSSATAGPSTTSLDLGLVATGTTSSTAHGGSAPASTSLAVGSTTTSATSKPASTGNDAKSLRLQIGIREGIITALISFGVGIMAL